MLTGNTPSSATHLLHFVHNFEHITKASDERASNMHLVEIVVDIEFHLRDSADLDSVMIDFKKNETSSTKWLKDPSWR